MQTTRPNHQGHPLTVEDIEYLTAATSAEEYQRRQGQLLRKAGYRTVRHPGHDARCKRAAGAAPARSPPRALVARPPSRPPSLEPDASRAG